MAGTQQLGGLCWGASGQVVDIAGSADGGGCLWQLARAAVCC